MSQYVSNYDADTYFLTRWNSGLWVQQSEDNKTALLITATRYIDCLNFEGDKTNVKQANEFPRGTDTVVPQSIKDATCEIAYQLITGRDVEYDALNSESAQMSFDTNREVFNDSVNQAKIHGIPSVIAWKKLLPYLRDGSIITLSRVD